MEKFLAWSSAIPALATLAEFLAAMITACGRKWAKPVPTPRNATANSAVKEHLVAVYPPSFPPNLLVLFLMETEDVV